MRLIGVCQAGALSFVFLRRAGALRLASVRHVGLLSLFFVRHAGALSFVFYAPHWRSETHTCVPRRRSATDS